MFLITSVVWATADDSTVHLQVAWLVCGLFPEGHKVWLLLHQAAVYGVGVCAEYGGTTFQPIVGGKLASFGQRVQSIWLLELLL